VNVFPQLHVTVVTWYWGWMSGFMDKLLPSAVAGSLCSRGCRGFWGVVPPGANRA
jgi:hypothetical protein